MKNYNDMWRGLQNTTYDIRIEIIVRIIIVLIVCVMHFNVGPHIRYITEKDLFLYYNLPRMESITPTWAVVFIVFFVPLIILTTYSYVTGNYNDLIQSLLAWTLAMSINAFVTFTGKLIVGRPRPDFYYRCFPDGEMTPDLQCTGTVKEEMEGRKSFPSGHSSFSVCSLGYISIWLLGLLGVLSRNRGEGLRVIICLFPIIVAEIVALTRYCDNHHHWEDIVVGSIIGLATSYFCYLQYYYPLDSNMSGQPYNPIAFGTFENISQEDIVCCTRHLTNNHNRNSASSPNKKHV